MDIRNMHNLDGGLATRRRMRSGRLCGHVYGIGFNGWPGAQTKDREAEELGGAGPDYHLAQVVGEDGTFEADCAGAVGC
jgi:hypothetical protein